MWPPVLEKEDSEFKPPVLEKEDSVFKSAFLHLKIHFVCILAVVEGLGEYRQYLFSSSTTNGLLINL